MYERKQEITEAVDRLYDKTRPLQRGDLLSNATIIATLGIEPDQINAGRVRHVIKRVRRRLLKVAEKGGRNIACLPEKGVGLRLLTEEQQVKLYPYVRRKRAYNQHLMSHRAVRAVPIESLSPHLRKVRLAKLKMESLNLRTLRAQLKEEREELQPTPPMPRRKAPRPRPRLDIPMDQPRAN